MPDTALLLLLVPVVLVPWGDQGLPYLPTGAPSPPQRAEIGVPAFPKGSGGLRRLRCRPGSNPLEPTTIREDRFVAQRTSGVLVVQIKEIVPIVVNPLRSHHQTVM